MFGELSIMTGSLDAGSFTEVESSLFHFLVWNWREPQPFGPELSQRACNILAAGQGPVVHAVSPWYGCGIHSVEAWVRTSPSLVAITDGSACYY